MEMDYRNIERMTEDSLRFIRILASDSTQNRVVRSILQFALQMLALILLIHLYYFFTVFEMAFFLKYCPLFGWTLYGSVTLTLIVQRTNFVRNFQRDLHSWSERCAGPNVHKTIKRQSNLLGIFVCLNTILGITTGFLHAMPRENESQYILLYKWMDDVLSPPAKFLLASMMRFCTVFCTFPMLLPTYQVLYGGFHLKFQINLLSQYSKGLEIGCESGVDEELFDNEAFQNEIAWRLQFCVKRHIHLRKAVTEMSQDIQWFMLAFVVTGLFTGIVSLIYIYTSITNKNYELGIAVCILFATNFTSLIVAGQVISDENVKLGEMMTSRPAWYNWNIDNRKYYLISLPHFMRPLHFLKYSPNSPTGYELGANILKAIYSIISVLAQIRYT